MLRRLLGRDKKGDHASLRGRPLAVAAPAAASAHVPAHFEGGAAAGAADSVRSSSPRKFTASKGGSVAYASDSSTSASEFDAHKDRPMPRSALPGRSSRVAPPRLPERTFAKDARDLEARVSAGEYVDRDAFVAKSRGDFERSAREMHADRVLEVRAVKKGMISGKLDALRGIDRDVRDLGKQVAKLQIIQASEQQELSDARAELAAFFRKPKYLQEKRELDRLAAFVQRQEARVRETEKSVEQNRVTMGILRDRRGAIEDTHFSD